MVHKPILKIVAHMLRNLENIHGEVAFNAPLSRRLQPTTLLMNLKMRAIGMCLKKYSGFEFNDNAPKILLVKNMKT